MLERRLAFSRTIEFDDLVRYARHRNWAAETPSGYPVTGTDPYEADAYVYSWRTEAGGVIRFVDDEVIEVQFIVFQAEDPDYESTAVASAFSCLTYTDCLNRLMGEPSPEELAKHLETLGAIAPREYDSAVYEAVSAGLNGESSPIRSAAISAALQLSWIEFRSPLQVVAERDPDHNNRAIASNALHVFPQP